MTCRDAIALLADYLEAELGGELAAELEGHLRDCAPCQAYLDTYRKTRELGAAAGRVAMPEEMRIRLHRLLLDRLREGAPPDDR